MNTLKYKILLADDDEDDCTFFKEAMDDLPFSVTIMTVSDGVQLMKFLSDTSSINLPDILFLDLNMPRKSGFECLSDIKSIDKLKHLPVIIFSTSLDLDVVDLLYKRGAIYYIRKPGDFSKLRKVILDALTITTQNNFKQPARDNFILQP
ncbi:response regulator [Chitinophagaceae bacterium IBVUCB2]|nr:response regulator [Chitinophagaceae bacterium IBVUCB2]